MNEMTVRDLIRALLPGGRPDHGADLAGRVDALTTLVFDLLVEVEALRQAQATEASYRDAYRAACLLTHNSAGVSSGWEKLMERYYPRQRSSGGRAWRESLMMRRLGMTPAEIEAYQGEAAEAETYT
jgi:hypothetical protein